MTTLRGAARGWLTSCHRQPPEPRDPPFVDLLAASPLPGGYGLEMISQLCRISAALSAAIVAGKGSAIQHLGAFSAALSSIVCPRYSARRGDG